VKYKILKEKETKYALYIQITHKEQCSWPSKHNTRIILKIKLTKSPVHQYFCRTDMWLRMGIVYNGNLHKVWDLISFELNPFQFWQTLHNSEKALFKMNWNLSRLFYRITNEKLYFNLKHFQDAHFWKDRKWQIASPYLLKSQKWNTAVTVIFLFFYTVIL
jgi:hypothetical protein